MTLSLEDIETLSKIGLEIGTDISYDGQFKFVNSEKVIQLSESLAKNIIVILPS